MRIRPEMLFAFALTAALCLASPADAAKKKRPAARTATAYSTNCTGSSWGTAGAGPLCNGPDYLGQDPDINIRAYILKDLGARYGGAY